MTQDMCGRSRCSLSPEQVVQAARVPEDRWKDKENYKPSHNVAPGYNTPVVKRDKQQELGLHTMKWGLVPSFTKRSCTEKPDHFRMFNARSETVAEKTVFSRLLHRQRCIVLVDGFYEWKKENTRKQPFYVNIGEGNVMRMAGLFDVWSAGDDIAPLYTYTILTTDSSKRLAWLHDRMPVLLTSDEQAEAWLATEPLSAKVYNTICTPYNGEDLVWHPVTPSMSSLSYQSPDASQNVEQKRGNIASFFKAANAKTAKASGSTSAPHASTQAKQGVAADATDACQARLNASSASELATGAPGYPGKHDECQDGDAGHETRIQPPDRHHSAGGHTEPEVVKLEGNHVAKEEPAEGDVLNTDDAGGIVAKSEPGSVPLNSPSSAKRSAPPAKSPIPKKAKTGTIDSFFGRKT